MLRRFTFITLFFVLFGFVALQAQTTPLTLKECVQIAMENNSNVVNAQHQVKISDASVTIARSALLPNVSANLNSGQWRIGPSEYLQEVPVKFDPVTQEPIEYQTRRISVPSSSRNTNSMRVSAGITVFDFGATYNSIKQTTASRNATKSSLQGIEQNTVFLVHQAYYDLLKAQRLVEVQEESVKQNEEQLKRTQSMYEIGSVAQADVYKSESNLGSAKINLITQKNSVRAAQANLNVVLGRPADMEISVVDLPDVTQPREYAMDNVLQKAESTNPDMQRFRFQMAAANHGRKSAKAAYLPTISASASYSRSNDEIDRVYTGFDKDWNISFGVSLNYNLFSGFRDMADVARQTYNYRIAAENLDQTRRDIKRSVIVALNNLQAYKEIAEINQAILLSSQEDLRLAQERYRVGAGTLLDVLTAQSSLTSSRSTLVRAKYDMKIYEAQLASLMGEL